MTEMELSIKIIIATHKPYEMPKDEVYLPVQVGSVEKTASVISGMMRVKISLSLIHISVS